MGRGAGCGVRVRGGGAVRACMGRRRARAVYVWGARDARRRTIAKKVGSTPATMPKMHGTAIPPTPTPQRPGTERPGRLLRYRMRIWNLAMMRQHESSTSIPVIHAPWHATLIATFRIDSTRCGTWKQRGHQLPSERSARTAGMLTKTPSTIR